MKKKKEKNLKGFTLIELLAVIVILAVIALIAVPQVLKILNKSRLSAAIDSTYGIVKSAETYISNFLLKNSGTLPSEDLVFECNGKSCNLENKDNFSSFELDGLEKLEFKGTKPKSGKVTISNSGNNIVTTDLVINSFLCGYIGGESICIKKGEYETKENGTVIYFNPETNEQCSDYIEANSDTENKQGCMKWYIFNDLENSMVYNLLLDHNTTAGVAWNSSGDNSGGMKEVLTQLISDTATWNNSLNPRLITADEVATITGKEDFTHASSSSYYFENNSNNEPTPYPSVAKYGWLFNRTRNNCENYGCLNNATGANISDMYGYWTSTPFSDDSIYAWRVAYRGLLIGEPVSLVYAEGVRPVITVPKNKIS